MLTLAPVEIISDTPVFMATGPVAVPFSPAANVTLAVKVFELTRKILPAAAWLIEFELLPL